MRIVAMCSLSLVIGMSTAALGESPEVVEGANNPTARGVHEHYDRDDLLIQKTAELERLQTEVYKLRRDTGQLQQVQIAVQAIEVSHANMRKLGFDFPQLSANSTTNKLRSATKSNSAEGKAIPSITVQITESNSITELIEALRQKNVLKILAEPNLITLDRCPAFFHCGGEFPIPIKHSDGSKKIQYRKFGTQVDLTASLLGGDKVRLEVRARFSQLDMSRSVTIDGEAVPGIRMQEIDTSVEMELGKTAILGGLIQQRIETKEGATVLNEVESLFLLTPTLAAAAPTASQGSQPAH